VRLRVHAPRHREALALLLTLGPRAEEALP
jgi:hypothetical protein